MSVSLKILHQNNKIVRNTYNKCGAGLQHGTSSVVSFSRIFSKYQEHLRMFVIHFFDCNVSSKNLLSLFLQKIRRPVLFSFKLITFNSNWWTNSLRETAVLDASENSHGNVYSEVPSEVVAYQHGVY